MKGRLLLLSLLLLHPCCPLWAGEGSQAFRDAFRSYVNIRRLEEKSRIAGERVDLEEGARQALTQKVAAELTEAKIDFQAFLQPGSKEFSSWERSILKNAGTPKAKGADKISLDFLFRHYPAAAGQWSPMEWQCAGEWFGKETEDSFLKTTFAMEELPKNAVLEKADEAVVWVTDPFTQFLAKDEAAQDKARRRAVKAQLETQGYTVEELEVRAYTPLDDQAEELRFALTQRLQDGPVILVSTGYGSAVLLRTLDLNPELLMKGSILGWVNVNGKLFGEPSGRKPASASKADRQLVDARHDLVLLREERLDRATPLSPKFPMLNLVTFAGGQRPGPSLRDSLLPEGKTVYVKKGDAIGALQSALPALKRRAPAGQRDPVSAPGL